MKLVVVSSLWCPSCIIMNNMLNEIKENNNLNIIDYDYDNDREIIEKYNIGKILPVFILLDEKDNEIKRLIGEKSKKEFLLFLNK